MGAWDKRQPGIKLNQLRDFLAVARTGGLRAAARDLDIAQPSLSKSIQTLEMELGATLFKRASRGAVLTPVGSALLVRAEAVMQELRRAREEVSQLTSGGGGGVAFGITAAPAFLFLARVLNDYRVRYPDVSVRVIDGIYPVVLPELKDGRLDFSVGPEPERSLGDDFTLERLFESTRVPVCRRGHPMELETSLCALTDAHWLVTAADQEPFEAFGRIFSDRNLPVPTKVTLCETSLGLVELLMNTDMICWLPRQWLDAPLLSSWLTDIPITIDMQGPDICLVRRRNLPLTPAADHLATLIRRACHRHKRKAEMPLTGFSEKFPQPPQQFSLVS